MVTTMSEKAKDLIDELYFISIMALLFPIFTLFWIVSLIKGKDLMEEGWA